MTTTENKPGTDNSPAETTPEQLAKYESMVEQSFARTENGKEVEAKKGFFYMPVSIHPKFGGLDKNTLEELPDVPQFLVQKYFRDKFHMTANSQGVKEKHYESAPHVDEKGRVDSDSSFLIDCVKFQKEYSRIDL